MNWKEISEKYPKAWEELRAWIADTRCRNAFGEYRLSLSGVYTCLCHDGKFTYDGKNGWTEFNPRDIYDYFDGLGIEGYVVPDGGDSLDCQVFDGMKGGETLEEKFETRVAAESALFTRMFELRESQLPKQPQKGTEQ